MTKKKSRQLVNSGNPKLVITPDSCTLNLMACEIPARFFIDDPSNINYVAPVQRPQYFFDLMFNGLPREKIKAIHILDIVGGEIFGKSADGTVYDDRFREGHMSKDGNLSVLSYAIYNKNADRNNFLRLHETSAGRPLLKALAAFATAEKAVSEYLTYCEPKESERIMEEFKKRMRSAKRLFSKNRGEYIIKEYILEHSDPTLFLSEDKKGREQVQKASEKNQEGCIYIDNLHGFLQVMERNGLLQKQGLKESVTSDIMIRHMVGKNKAPAPKSFLQPCFSAINGEGKSGQTVPIDSWFSR